MTKKPFAGMMAAVFASFALIPFSVAAASSKRFTLSDLVKVSQYLAGQTQLTEQQQQEFDLTGDGRITLSDLVLMAKDLQTGSSAQPVSTQAPASDVSEQDARELAISLVPGATESDIVSSRLDHDNGVPMYDVEIVYDNAQYEFDIAAAKEGSDTPVVYKQSMDRRPTAGYQGSEQTDQSARDIMLERVEGAVPADITEFKLDVDDGVQVYEGTLYHGGKKYESTIVKATGEVISWSEERTVLPQAPVVSTQPADSPQATPTAAASAPSEATITLQQAQKLALERVPGAVQSNIVSSQLDDSDLGIQVYDIELHHNGVQYDYEFSRTGALIKESIERPYDPSYEGSVQTEQSAQQLVLGAVPGADTSNITSSKLDTDDGVQVYDIDLVYHEQKWSFEIAQATGQILQQSMELLTVPASAQAAPAPGPTTAAIPPEQTLSAQQAQQIAVDRIPGASLNNITSTGQDTVDGVPVFDIDVVYNGAEYEYEITTTGTILKESMERPATPGYQGTQQTEQSAKDIAAGFVPGATAANVTGIKQDMEDGARVYDIDLVYNDEIWSFEIVQETGEVIGWSMKKTAVPDPMPAVSAAPAPAQQGVSRDVAIAAALARVPSATTANVVKCDLDTESGYPVYEIEIRYNRVEYDITVSTTTGQIMLFDVDHDD